MTTGPADTAAAAGDVSACGNRLAVGYGYASLYCVLEPGHEGTHTASIEWESVLWPGETNSHIRVCQGGKMTAPPEDTP